MKKWYNGFSFGKLADIYNPWSITKFISAGRKYRPYWTDTVANALAQIEERKYDTTLTAKGIAPEKISKYGFAFEGKNCLIG